MNDATRAADAGLVLAPLPALVTPQATDAELAAAALPVDHPAWQRDVVSISQRVRALLATLRPIVIRVETFWDHTVRMLRLGEGRFEVDPSGSYRLKNVREPHSPYARS